MAGIGTVCFSVRQSGEMDVGIFPFADEVSVQCCSGDFGGNPGEFEEFMRTVLEEWYDGAKVAVSDNCPPHLPDFYRGSRICTGKGNTKGTQPRPVTTDNDNS